MVSKTILLWLTTVYIWENYITRKYFCIAEDCKTRDKDCAACNGKNPGQCLKCKGALLLIGGQCRGKCDKASGGQVNFWLDTLQWRHDEREGVSNHQPHDCLLNRLFRHRWQKTSKLRVTGLCEGNSPVTNEFPAQRPSNADSVSIRWRHHTYGSNFERVNFIPTLVTVKIWMWKLI